jgi:hypothetical protein
MALVFTQPLAEMSTRNLPGGYRAAGAYGWQPYRHLWADCLENVGAPSLTTLWVSTASCRDSFVFFFLPFYDYQNRM